nr:MAG TPA: hypothetical protein [Microviridae sp.]
MSKRKMRRSADRKVFSNTAVTTRKINLNPISYRGGIRL